MEVTAEEGAAGAAGQEADAIFPAGMVVAGVRPGEEATASGTAAMTAVAEATARGNNHRSGDRDYDAKPSSGYRGRYGGDNDQEDFRRSSFDGRRGGSRAPGFNGSSRDEERSYSNRDSRFDDPPPSNYGRNRSEQSSYSYNEERSNGNRGSRYDQNSSQA